MRAPAVTIEAGDSSELRTSATGTSSSGPSSPEDGARGRGRLMLWLTIAAAGAVLSPVLGLGFFGDDFDLWLVGQEVLRDPSLLLIGPENFYRPANAWLFAGHDLLFGPHPLGNHLTTLALHLLCGVLLWALLGRFAVGQGWRCFAAFFWLTSPFTFEPVWAVNVAYNDLTVCAIWLAMATFWPQSRWTTGRAAGLMALALLSMFCKESWVIVPALAVVFELTLRRTSVRTAALTGTVAAVPVAIYLIAYAQAFSDRLTAGGDYTGGGLDAWLKVPHAWSTFWGLVPLQPADFSFGLAEAIGSVLFLVLVALAILRRDRLIGLGLAVFVLPFIPILPVPWLPPRYTAAPFIGFVLAAVATGSLVLTVVPRRKTVAVIGVVVIATLLTGRQLVLLRGELHDVQRLDAAHQLLLVQAEAYVPQLPDVDLLVCLRLDPTSPPHALQAAGHRGMAKTYFLRPAAPYDLIHWEALLTFALARHGCDRLWLRLSDRDGPLPQSWAVLAHQNGRIVTRPTSSGSPPEEIALWQQRGVPVRVLIRADSPSSAATSHHACAGSGGCLRSARGLP